MAYDPIRDEIVVPQFYAQAILTFRGAANGDEAPIRIIRGPDTQLTTPARLALDPVHDEIFIPLEERLLVFPRDGQGNVAPIRVIEGPDTQMSASTVVVDPVHNLLIVGGTDITQQGESRGGQVLIFNRTDAGNVKPRAAIRGPKTGINRRVGLMAIYPPRGLFLVGKPFAGKFSTDNFVGVWSIKDDGDVPPRWTIGGPNGTLRQVRGITLDPKHKSVIISDKYLNAVLTFYFPEIF